MQTPRDVRPNGCPACNGAALLRRRGEKRSHTLWECRQCGVLFADSAPNRNGNLYERYYDQARFVTPPTVVASLQRLVCFAEQFRVNGRWLDFGYGEGGLLAIAERSGWSCYGVEISDRPLEHGRLQGWVVTREPSRDARFVPGAFDVVTMIEVLEHVPTPRRLLGDVVRWLRPGGLLYLTTPNLRSLNGRVLGLTWSIVAPPEHLVLWTRPALRRVVSEAGFQILRVRTEGLNPAELLARVRRGWATTVHVDRNATAVALSQALERSKIRRTFKNTINAGLNVLGLGDTLKVWARRGG